MGVSLCLLSSPSEVQTPLQLSGSLIPRRMKESFLVALLFRGS